MTMRLFSTYPRLLIMSAVYSLFSITAPAQIVNSNSVAVRDGSPISDPLRHYLAYQDRPCDFCDFDTIRDAAGPNLLLVRLDLNGDGRDDFVLSSTSRTNARAGNVWTVYVSHGDVFRLQPELVSFRRDAFGVVDYGENGSQLIAISLPSGGGDGNRIGIGYENGAIQFKPLQEIAPDLDVEDLKSTEFSASRIEVFDSAELRVRYPDVYAPPGTSLSPGPQVGGSTQYYDLDATGRLLHIDYAAKTATVIANIDLSGLPPATVLWGEILPRDHYLQVFWSEPKVTPTFLGQYNIPAGRFIGNPIKIDALFFCRFLPLSRDKLSFLLVDSKGKCAAYLATFDEEQHLKKLNSGGRPLIATVATVDRLFTFVPSPIDNGIVEKVDLRTGKIVDTVHTEEIVSRVDNEVLRVVLTISNSSALLARRTSNVHGNDLFLIDLEQKVIAAHTTDTPPTIGGQWKISSIVNDSYSILCIEQRRDMPEKQSLYLYSANVKESRIDHVKSVEFDPKREIPLFVDESHIAVLPLYRFDYVSMRDLFVAWSDSPPLSHETRRKSIAELSEGFGVASAMPIESPVNLVAPGIPVEHLVIKK